MTVSEIIDALGGTGKVAEKLGMLPSRVSNWRSFGRFPDSVSIHRRISEICDAEGIELDPALFEPRRDESAA